MRQDCLAPGVDLAWADDYAEVCAQRDEALEQLGLLRRALADGCRYYWPLMHSARRQRTKAPTLRGRINCQQMATEYEHRLRALLTVRRAGRANREEVRCD